MDQQRMLEIILVLAKDSANRFCQQWMLKFLAEDANEAVALFREFMYPKNPD